MKNTYDTEPEQTVHTHLRALIFELDEIPAEDAPLLWEKFLEKVKTAPFAADKPKMEVTNTGQNDDGESYVSVKFSVLVAINYVSEDDIHDEERSVMYHFYPDFDEGEII